MYTVMKHLAVNFVTFEGPPYQDYPDWFKDRVLPYIVEDEFGYHVLMGSGDPIDGVSIYPEEYYDSELKLVEGWDIFIMNPKGDVQRITDDLFFKHFTIVTGNVAALNDDVMRYTIYQGYGDIIPEWMGMGVKTSGDITVMDTLMNVLNDVDDKLLMSHIMVILLNSRNETHYLSIEQFDEHMVSSEFNSNYVNIDRPSRYEEAIPDEIDVPYHIMDEDMTFDGLPW